MQHRVLHYIEMNCGVIPMVFRATKIIATFSGGGLQATIITTLRITTWSPAEVLTDLGDD